MTDDDLPLSHISNQPPPAESAGMEIDTRLSELEARKAEVLAAFTPDRLIVNDIDTVGRTADKVSIAKRFLDRVDGVRREVKDPFDLAVTTVQSRTQAFTTEVSQAIAKAEGMIRDFRTAQREKARLAQEEQRKTEAQLREEMMDCYQFGTVPAPAEADPEPVTAARPRAAPPVAPEVSLPAVRGDYGSKVSDQQEKVFTIDDPRLLPDTILKSTAVQKAILAAVRQLYRLQKEIPGVTVKVATGDKIRRAG